MSWAEFVLRSIAFKENREFEMTMVREITYQVYAGQFIWGSKKPVAKDKFWPIGNKNKKSIPDNLRLAFMNADAEYRKKKNG